MGRHGVRRSGASHLDVVSDRERRLADQPSGKVAQGLDDGAGDYDAACGTRGLVFETIFAVTYAHLYRWEWPSVTMLIGMVCLVAGVVLSLRVFYR